MGERGPKPMVVLNLTPEERRELDTAIIDGRETKADLYGRYKARVCCSYRNFCNYASRLEARAKNRYVGELLTGVFGNMPDSEIDVRARGVVMGILNRLAMNVMEDGEINPKDLRDVVKAFDMIRRGAIADADASRRRLEWEVVRTAGVAEAAEQIKRELATEVGSDSDLRHRLEQAVDRIKDRADKPAREIVTAQIIDKIARKRGLAAGALNRTAQSGQNRARQEAASRA